MRKLIIGCGYLGQRVARRWRQSGDDVAALTRSVERAEEFRAQGIEPVVGDVLDPESLRNLPEAGTVLYAVGYDRSAEPSKADVYVNGLQNVLNALNGNFERLIYISSTSVYGQSHGEIVDEESACEPTTDSGRICINAEQVLRQSIPAGDDEATPGLWVLRCAGLYGPGRLLRRAGQLRSREPLGGNPLAYLNLIHIDDAVAAVEACDNHSGNGATVLVCDGEWLARRDYYSTLSRLSGAPAPVFREQENASAGLNKRCDNSRLRNELGVRLRYPTAETGLKHALENTPPD